MKSVMRKEGVLTVDSFFGAFKLEYIINSLRGAFTRGLPKSDQLSECPKVANMFRHLLAHGMVTGNSKYAAAIQFCHGKGWIYAEEADQPSGPQLYTFPSPLHHTALSWRLEPKNQLPSFVSPYALSLEVLKRFKHSQLNFPIRRVSRYNSNDPLPEAQYQDEFYRCLFAVTCGNVRISPEFASARGARVAGRIDFFIPIVKWGIEITREGDRLQQHASRFATSSNTIGAYGQWLKDGDIQDYIFLDCRTTIPKTSHPGMISHYLEIPIPIFLSGIHCLYHAVFQDEYRMISMYNNQCQLIKGPITLQ